MNVERHEYRWQVINAFARRYNYARYLEVGLGDGETLARIEAPYKVSVDPSSPNATCQVPSDTFFAFNKEQFDLIFIDGCHEEHQVARDIVNSLQCLAPNGTIVVHDCNPRFVEREALDQSGTVWRAWAWFRMVRDDLSMFVVDTDDGGCGVIRRGSQKLFPRADQSLFNYGLLELHREELLNLVEPEWPNWMDENIQHSVSLIIPTIGRDSLARLLSQVHPQLAEQDEVMVAADGPSLAAKSAVIACEDRRIRYCEVSYGPMGDWGHTVRNLIMPLASGSHLFFLDDDDECLPGAYETIRAAVAKTPNKILLFRVRHEGGVIWRAKEVVCGNVSTQMVVVPNVKGRLGAWLPHTYDGDYRFIQSCVYLHPLKEKGVEWREEVIATHGIGG